MIAIFVAFLFLNFRALLKSMHDFPRIVEKTLATATLTISWTIYIQKDICVNEQQPSVPAIHDPSILVSGQWAW